VLLSRRQRAGSHDRDQHGGSEPFPDLHKKIKKRIAEKRSKVVHKPKKIKKINHELFYLFKKRRCKLKTIPR
jgi:hypothetical protein